MIRQFLRAVALRCIGLEQLREDREFREPAPIRREQVTINIGRRAR